MASVSLVDPARLSCRRRQWLVLAGAACSVGGSLVVVTARANTAAASDAGSLPPGYPSKPLRVVVPYPPGGATDVIARVMSPLLSAGLRQPVIVDNRAGAAGSIGAAALAREKPDGYSLLMAAVTSHTMNAALFGARLPFDIETSFAPIARVGRVPLVIVAGRHLQVRDLAGLVALAKSRPGALSYASSGNGSPQHLAAELFQRLAGIRLLHVPYKGSGPAVSDLVGGQVDVLVDAAPAVQAFIRSGQLLGLATSAAEPQPNLPGVLTARAAGLAGFDVHSTFGLLAPAGTPSAVVKLLDGVVRERLDDAKVRGLLRAQAVEPAYLGPEAFGRAIREEVQRWRALIQSRGIVAD